MGSGEAQVSMAAQGINTTIQVANTTVSTILQLLMKEQPQLKNPESLVVNIHDIDAVLNELNSAGIPWTAMMERVPQYAEDENGERIIGDDGKPIIIGYEESPARTPDGQNCIIMVSGHDRPKINPQTGEVILTEKGNVKMTGGNIDKAAAIRNVIRENRLQHEIKGHDLPKDSEYKGDYVKIHFDGFESRAQFMDELKTRTSLSCIIPEDYSDTSLYVRKDAFGLGSNGEPSLAGRVLKEFYFKKQFPEYNEYLKRADADIKKTNERVNDAIKDPELVVRFERPFNEIEYSPMDLESELFYIKEQTGYANIVTSDEILAEALGFSDKSERQPKAFNLADIRERNEFVNELRNNGYTFSLEGLEPSEQELDNLEIRGAQDREFRALQDDMTILNMDLDKYIREHVHLEFKDGGKKVEPGRNAIWTDIEVRIDGTDFVNHIVLDTNEKENAAAGLTERLRNANNLASEYTVSVTMIDGESLNASLYANETVRNSDEARAFQQKDPIDKFHEEHFSDIDIEYYDKGSEQENGDMEQDAEYSVDIDGNLVSFDDSFEQGEDDYFTAPQV